MKRRSQCRYPVVMMLPITPNDGQAQPYLKLIHNSIKRSRSKRSVSTIVLQCTSGSCSRILAQLLCNVFARDRKSFPLWRLGPIRGVGLLYLLFASSNICSESHTLTSRHVCYVLLVSSNPPLSPTRNSRRVTWLQLSLKCFCRKRRISVKGLSHGCL